MDIRKRFRWWDNKRIWYNLILGSVAISYIIYINPDYFGIGDVIGILIYAFGANLLFSLGILVELYDFVYLENRLKLHRLGWFLFIIGTLFSILYTILQIETYYFGFLAGF